MSAFRAKRGLYLAAFGAAVIGLARCATPGIPPGGPEDEEPPQILRIAPESGAVNVRAREFALDFDEVVSESPTGANASVGGGGGGGGGGAANYSGPSLAGVVLLSPRSGALRVDWHRDHLTIRPRNTLKPNTTYTLTILPGISDLRNNPRDSAVVSVFATGSTIATGRIGGIVFDWVAGKSAPRALVELIAPDSTTYLAIADSVGRFVVPNIPTGTYVLRGVIDVNNNRAFDPREMFDTVRVGPAQIARGDSAKIEILAFVHDSLGPRLGNWTIRDSVTLRVSFDKPLDPAQPLLLNRFALIATRDSSVVPIVAVQTATQFDSAQARLARARADSVARADTTKRDSARAARPAVPVPPRDTSRRDTSRARRIEPPPVPSKPSPQTDIVFTLGTPLRPQTAYRLVARGQRSVSGVATDSSTRNFSTPKAEPPPKKGPNDSTRADTTRRDTARVDTTRVRRPR